MAARLVIDEQGWPSDAHIAAIRAVAIGSDYSAIATRIHVSRRTVSRLVDDLKQLTGTAGLAELVAEASRRGWLGGPDPSRLRGPAGAHPVAVPRQLPADPSLLIGRDGLVRTIGDLIDNGARAVACAGPGGVGKSTVIARAAHTLAGRYPDGQLYATLRGGSGLAPLDPIAILGRFLRALGVPGGMIPTDPDEAAAMWRSLLVSRRMLIVLDDAGSASQIRSLMPADSSSAVLVTSRPKLVALDGAVHLDVPLLGDADAAAVVAGYAGRYLADDPGALAELCALAGRLPLALRIIGARVTDRDAGGLRELAAEMRDEQSRLDALEVDDLGVRGAFASSYRRLPASSARAFRLLAVAGLPEIGVRPVAAMLDVATADAAAVLATLVRAQLVESPALGRFRMHDLVRLYATDCATADEPAGDRAPAWDRLVEHYRHGVFLAGSRIRVHPGNVGALPAAGTRRYDVAFSDRAAAADWLAEERENVMVLAASTAGTDGPASTFADDTVRFLRTYFSAVGRDDDLIELSAHAIRAAERTGDTTQLIYGLADLAMFLQARGDLAAALGYAEKAAALARDTGDDRLIGNTMGPLGVCQYGSGRPDDGFATLQATVAWWTRAGLPHGVCTALHNMAELYLDAGRPDDTIAAVERSLQIREQMGDDVGTMLGRKNLGMGYLQRGDFDTARSILRGALELSVAQDNMVECSYINSGLAEIALREQRPELAQQHADRALTAALAVQHPYGQSVALRQMARALEMRGDDAAAARCRLRIDALAREHRLSPLGSLERTMSMADLSAPRR